MELRKNNPEVFIIHHSLTKDNVVLIDTEAIRRYHIENNGWTDIGYHYVIEKVNGKWTVKNGRPENIEGAHCKAVNTKSIGICIVGNFDKYAPEEEAYFLCAELIRNRKAAHNKNMPIEPHNKYSQKTCPGTYFDMQHLIDLADKPIVNVSLWAQISWYKAVEKRIQDGLDPQRVVTEEHLMVFFDKLRLLD